MPACIFHHPFPVISSGNAGSSVRTAKMLNAFQDLGFEVESIIGFATERRGRIKVIKEDISKGRSFDFIYSESHTMPTLLTEPHHLPLNPDLDFGFFRYAKHIGIPIGLFYRDVYWRFELYKEVSWFKRALSIPMYKYDWFQYQQLLDHLFLPSQAMEAYLPSKFGSISALPPGANLAVEATHRPRKLDQISLFYVGGISAPLYNLAPSFKALAHNESVDLTICCRKEEWKSHSYPELDNVTYIHASGSALKEYYQAADLFCLLREPHEYLDFAMPVKILEAISYALPIVISSGSEAARFVEQEGAGWVIDSLEQFDHLIAELKANPNILEEKRKHMQTLQAKHSWQARARQVAETLTAL